MLASGCCHVCTPLPRSSGVFVAGCVLVLAADEWPNVSMDAGDGDEGSGEGDQDKQRHIIFKLDCSFLQLQYCLFSITMAFSGLIAAIQYSCGLQKRKLLEGSAAASP